MVLPAGRVEIESVVGGQKHDPSSCGARIQVCRPPSTARLVTAPSRAKDRGNGQWALEREAPMGAVEVVVVRELDQDGAEVSAR